jgi:hypothetical protein
MAEDRENTGEWRPKRMKAQIASIRVILFVMLLAALLSTQAWAGCGRWVIRENTDYLEDPIFDDAVKASTMSGTTGTEPSNDSAVGAVNDSVKPKPEAKKNVAVERSFPDISGKWLFALPENLGGNLDLILMQSGSRLQGYAQLMENGSQVTATATGTVSQDSVDLDIRTVKSKESRRLDLALIKNTLEGNCELYEGDRLLEKGNATATRNGA